MKLLKKTVCAAMALTMALSLAACGKQAEEAPVQETPAEEAEPVVTVPTLAELRAANDPIEVLKRNQTVSIVMETRDVSGDLKNQGPVSYRALTLVYGFSLRLTEIRSR